MTKIEKTINQGITQTTINNIYQTNTQDTTNAIKTLLQPLVKDQEILNLLTQDQNQQKLKHRLQHQIQIQDNTNQTLLNLQHIGKKTIQQVINEIQKNIPAGTNIDSEEGTPKNTNILLQTLRQLGYTTQTTHQGTTAKAKLTITFRKAQ